MPANSDKDAPSDQWRLDNTRPLSEMHTVPVWDGKYEEFGRRREVDVAALSDPTLINLQPPMRALRRFLVALMLICHSSLLFGQSTAFTYQGRLNDGSNPANGSYDLRFAVFDKSTNGNQQGPILTNGATSVSNGLFNVVLDFGNQFSGPDRWLEIAVRTNGNGNFITLSPRQPVTAIPYAITAANVLAGGIPSGIYTNAVIFSNLGNQFAGNGRELTNLNAANVFGTFTGNGSGLTNQLGTELYIDVQRDFGAKGDGVTDDTAAIQSAINAATGNTNSSTTGIIYFRQGRYLIAGNTTNASSSQLTIPVKTGSSNSSSITFTGQKYIANSDGSANSGTLATSGALLVSTATSGSVIRSLGGAINYMCPVFEHLSLQIQTNAPVTGLNLWEFTFCQVYDFSASCGFGTMSTPLPNSNSCAILLPQSGMGDRIILRDINVCGIGSAISSSEHMDADSININGCIIGFNFQFAYHLSKIGRAIIQATAYPLYWTAANPVVIEALAIEHDTNTCMTTPVWQQTIADVYDPNSVGLGTINYRIIMACVGTATNQVTKVGGTNVFCLKVGEPIPNSFLSASIQSLSAGNGSGLTNLNLPFAPATNTIVYITNVTGITNASGVVTNLTLTLGTNTIYYQQR